MAYTLDTTAAAPTLALATDSGTSSSDKITNASTLNVTGLEAGATWQYSLDGGTNWLTGSGTTITGITGDGAKSVIVHQTDKAGNTSADSAALAFTLDTTAPTLTMSESTMSGSTVNSSSTAVVSFTFSEDVGSSFALTDVAATQGSLSSMTQTDATHYTATFTPDPIIANGSGTSLTNWTSFNAVINSNHFYLGANDVAGSYIRQTFDGLVVGNTYTVNYTAGEYTDAVAQTQSLLAGVYTTGSSLIASQTLTSATLSTAAAAFSFTFVATATSHFLQFYDTTGVMSNDLWISNVSITGAVDYSLTVNAGAFADLAGNTSLTQAVL